MNIRAAGGGAGLSPELAAAITAAVHAFFEQDPVRLSERRSDISAWRMVAHAASVPGLRAWRGHD